MSTAPSPYATAKEAADYLRYRNVRAFYYEYGSLGLVPFRRRGGRTLLFDWDEVKACVSRPHIVPVKVKAHA